MVGWFEISAKFDIIYETNGKWSRSALKIFQKGKTFGCLNYEILVKVSK